VTSNMCSFQGEKRH